MADIVVGIDTGGTFTDVVLWDLAAGVELRLKAPTTPADPARGILEALAAALARTGGTGGDVALVAHGTTLATNAVLEGKWARTGLISTEGFRDILDLARQRRPSFFNLDIEKPTPPAVRDRRIDVPERMSPEGDVVRPLDETAVRAAARQLAAENCAAIAICFLHSYANPEHERRAAEIVREEAPRVFVSASSDVLAEFREFERFATTTVNASLTPVIDRYLAALETGLAELGAAGALRVMQSNGGAATAGEVRRLPVNTFFSGPAGGVIGAAAAGVAAGYPDLVTFDMGGTSTDVSLVEGGVPGRRNVREMGGFPVRARTLDLHTIGAGGGSLAWIDPGGLLKVGPASAGAEPGPACYVRGGERPTVTDANMVLGRLNPEALAGGAMPVDPDLAWRAVETHVARPLGMDVAEAAAGVLEIVNANMMGAVRVISVERGDDPRRFALCPFGGAGPLHAADVAAMIGMETVFLPERPGVLSALGLLKADARGEFGRTVLRPAAAEHRGVIAGALSGLRAEADAWLLREGLAPASARFEALAEMRYLGQNHDLSIPAPADSLSDGALDRLAADFHAAHERAYGHGMLDRQVEIVTLRLAVVVPREAEPPAPTIDASGPPKSSSRKVWFRETGFVETAIYDRDGLGPGARFEGPAIVEQMDATTVVPPGASVEVDGSRNIVMRLKQGGRT